MSGEDAAALAIDALNSLAIPYMLVGSFSTNRYGIPRSTKDADIVVQYGDRSVLDLVRALGNAFRLDPQMRFETVTGTRHHRIHVADTAFMIEVFELSGDPHDRERFARRIPLILFDRPSFLPTAEDVIVTKLRWALHAGRSKDREDARDVIAVQEAEGRLDWDYIYHWCDAHGTRELLDETRRSIPPIDEIAPDAPPC